MGTFKFEHETVIEEMTRRVKQTRSRQVDFQLVTAPIGNTNPGAKS